MSQIVVPTILCGGSGTRLWPVSRTSEPKQLQILFGDRSLFHHTIDRLGGVEGSVEPLIICNRQYSDEIDRIVHESGNKVGAILEEPMGRDTAAAAAVAAQWVVETYGEDAIVVLLPADHFVRDVHGFQRAISKATEIASANYVATIGITPTHPETGYGYILRTDEKSEVGDGFLVSKFVEKPDLETAKEYLSDGNYLWNAGIFAMKAGHYLSELMAFEPEIAKACRVAYSATSQQSATVGTSARIRLPSTEFSKVQKKSVDYAVMERTERMAVVPGEFGWNDVGNWASVKELGEKDPQGNVVEGNALLLGTSNSLVQSPNRTAVVVGLDNVIVIDTEDAVLVCNADQAHDVKKAHASLAEISLEAAEHHGTSGAYFGTRIRSWAKDWLFNKALPFWASAGADPVGGGVYEELDRNGDPLTNLSKRFRVQARQVYTFAHAYTLGWKPGLEALKAPLDFMLAHCHRSDGGWGHTYHRNGEVDDSKLDTYDQAFALLALAWVYKVTGEERYRDLAAGTLKLLKADLKHPTVGFLEGRPTSGYRRANPHMHLLETALHWVELHNDAEMADLADGIVSLYEEYFCVNGLLREYFNEDLSLTTDEAFQRVEPGHLFEWAYLLKRYNELTGKPVGNVATLVGFAETFGMNAKTGLLYDTCLPDGTGLEGVGSRLWPQTEYIRYNLQYGDAAARQRGLEMLDRVRKIYLADGREDKGIWADRVDADGKIIADQAPASTFYHILGALLPLVE